MPVKDMAAYMRRRRAAKRIGLTQGSRKPVNAPINPGRPTKVTPEMLTSILTAMLKPYTGLELVAKAYGISVQAIYKWQKESAQDEAEGKTDSPFHIDYLDTVSWFHRHMAFVRAVAVARIDSRIIEAATSSHFEPLFSQQTGQPFWKVDAKVAADAKSLDSFDWDLAYGGRDRDDVYERDAGGSLIQVTKEIAPQPALLIKAASSLLSQTYGEKVAHSVQIGGVVRIGGPSAPKQLAPAPTHQTLDADFTPIDEDATEPVSVLAVAEPPETVAEFEEVFGGKRLVEAILFYTEDKKLLPPLADITIVEGSSVHKAYVDAGIKVEAVPAADLIAQGYCNDFLLALAGPKESALVRDLREKLKQPIQHRQPSHHVDIGRPDAEAKEDEQLAREAEAAHARGRDLRSHPRAYEVDTLTKPRPAPGKGERAVRLDSGERVGYGVAPPGGVSVTQFPGRSITR